MKSNCRSVFIFSERENSLSAGNEFFLMVFILICCIIDKLDSFLSLCKNNALKKNILHTKQKGVPV